MKFLGRRTIHDFPEFDAHKVIGLLELAKTAHVTGPYSKTVIKWNTWMRSGWEPEGKSRDSMGQIGFNVFRYEADAQRYMENISGLHWREGELKVVKVRCKGKVTVGKMDFNYFYSPDVAFVEYIKLRSVDFLYEED
jgi:hypothetical protein